jgi:glycosyltransferase involved in cell wall biosynthesis
MEQVRTAESPLISIVTPVLNRVALLKQTLESVSAAASLRVEHVIVDGGSTHGTLEPRRRALLPAHW